MIRISFILLFGLLAQFSFGQSGVSHKSYDELLQKYVDDQGLVNYKGLQSERKKLQSYLSMLESNPPQKSWNENEKLAYWINAYNAFTLE